MRLRHFRWVIARRSKERRCRKWKILGRKGHDASSMGVMAKGRTTHTARWPWHGFWKANSWRVIRVVDSAAGRRETCVTGWFLCGYISIKGLVVGCVFTLPSLSLLAFLWIQALIQSRTLSSLFPLPDLLDKTTHTYTHRKNSQDVFLQETEERV